MKIKSGFTLAEVLITLAIIGVVATLTLPSLMTNTKEQQYVAALKKGINTITSAVTLNSAKNGFDFNDIDTTSASNAFGDPTDIYATNGGVNFTIAAIIGANANIDSEKTGTTEIVLKDGSSIMAGSGTCTARKEEGVEVAAPIVFDANGPQAPNKHFTCTGEKKADGTVDANSINCNKKEQRIVGDRFNLCVGGTSVYAQDDATSWAIYGTQSAK